MITVFPQSRLQNDAEPRLKNWQMHLREAITDIHDLCDILNLPDEFRIRMRHVSQSFPLKVPRGFIAKMQTGNVTDPLLRQILPLPDETLASDGYSSDPVSDLRFNPDSGIIHKYHGRVLLITTGACAVHCRYCFRREFPYSEQTAARQMWQTPLNYIQEDLSIHEVILSGGDPLSLSDAKLSVLLDALNNIEHVKTIRFHTRLPVVLPERVDAAFLETLKRSDKRLVFVLHANHANELCTKVKAACDALIADCNVTLLNQSVLLRGVNDDAKTLVRLSHRLHELKTLPYYLNMLDQVNGTQHFYVTEESAKSIYSELLRLLPGYLVPKLVRDEGNNWHKSSLYR